MDNNFDQPDIFNKAAFNKKSNFSIIQSFQSPNKAPYFQEQDVKELYINKVYPTQSGEKLLSSLNEVGESKSPLKNQIQIKKSNLKIVSNTCDFEIKERVFEISKEILKTKPIKKFKKNANLPKFICRYFIENYHKYSESFEEDQKMMKEMKSFIKQKKMKIRENKNSFYSIQHVSEIFQIKTSPQKSFFSRKVMNQIINKEILKIIKNPRLKYSLKTYITSLKVYRNRIINKVLMQRMQYK